MELFKINVSKYDITKKFDIVTPSSLDNPKDNSVMFITLNFMHKMNNLKNIRNCLLYWPLEKEIPKWLDQENNVIICVDNPHLEFCKFFKDNNIMNLPKKEVIKNIGNACVAESAKIGDNCIIMPLSYIGGDVTIGSNVYIGVGTKVIGKVNIGDNVVIRENSVIGADGLTTDRDENGIAVTMPQFGGVIIEDDVQIGSNSIIARGAIDNTIIKKGCKIDNSVFISHNVVLGPNTFIVGESILFGSSRTGSNVLISGNSTIRNGVEIGDNTVVGMGSVVTKNVSSNKIILGNPAKERG